MPTRINQLPSDRIKRTSFVTQTKALQRKHTAKLPKKIDLPTSHLEHCPWKIEQNKFITIKTTVLYRTLAMATIDENYPQEAWMRVYTDRSATQATKNGGVGVFIHYINGNKQREAIPTASLRKPHGRS